MQDDHTKIWITIQEAKHEIANLKNDMNQLKTETQAALDRIVDQLDQLLDGERPAASEAANKIKDEIDDIWSWINGFDKDLKTAAEIMKKNGLEF